MNSVIVLCVGLIGAANPATETAKNHQPVQVAFAGCSIASGGCYQQPAYRSPVTQRGPVGYPKANCICPPGACANGQCLASCPNGQCRSMSYTAGTAANCPNGQCAPTGSYYTAGQCYGPNCPPQNRATYYPSTGTQYKPLPATRYPVGTYTQPRPNPYSAGRTHNVNWTNTYRPVQPASYSNTTSPFFN